MRKLVVTPALLALFLVLFSFPLVMLVLAQTLGTVAIYRGH